MELNEVSQYYDRAAGYYDRLTDIVFGRILGLEKYRRQAVDLLGDIRGAVVLDIGCGTGRNFNLLVHRTGEHGRIIGVDYSEGMLERARQRIRTEGWDTVELIRADAVRLEMISEPVDAIVSVWCMGILYDLETALNRAVDLLRPGGRLAIIDFEKSRPDHGPLRWLYPLYSFALQRAGIDTAEDLDNEMLQAKWKRGRRVLESRLGSFYENHYSRGTGLILAGKRRPL